MYSLVNHADSFLVAGKPPPTQMKRWVWFKKPTISIFLLLMFHRTKIQLKPIPLSKNIKQSLNFPIQVCGNLNFFLMWEQVMNQKRTFQMQSNKKLYKLSHQTNWKTVQFQVDILTNHHEITHDQALVKLTHRIINVRSTTYYNMLCPISHFMKLYPWILIAKVAS